MAKSTALSDIEEIKDVSQTQASNHLSHIETSSQVTRDETIKTNAKLDVLIEVIQKRP
jgi:hypothetical protein